MKTIKIKGDIIPNDYKKIYAYFGWDGTCPADVAKILNDGDINEPVTVEINSPGGSVFSGSEIYTALMEHVGQVTVKVVGLAASAASVIAMAGSRILMSPTAQMMIHNVSTYAHGDSGIMRHTADVLDGANVSIANAYQLKTGLARDTLLEMMGKETWFNAQQAKEAGLVDEIMFNGAGMLVAATEQSHMLPPDVVDKMTALLAENKKLNEQLERERLNTLKQRGL